MKKVLWVIPRVFYPVTDGASKANYSLLNSLNSFEGEIPFDVTLLIFTESGKISKRENDFIRKKFPIVDIIILKKNVLKFGLSRIYQVLKCLFSKEALTPSFFNLKFNRTKLESLNTFDLVLCDGLHPYCGLRKYFSNFIYRSHNVEYDLWNPDDFSWLTRFIIRLQKRKIKVLERELIERAQVTWTISNEDKETYISDFKVPNDRVVFMPMTQKFLKTEKIERPANKFLFVGKLDWHPNTEGLTWLLENVASKVSASIEFHIVGGGEFPKHKYSHLKNVKFLGFVENLDDVYRECTASLIPIFSGSGTRIKVVEALAQGIPILSTTFGVQGSGLTNFGCELCDTVEGWIGLLNNWDNKAAQSKINSAQNMLENVYGDLLFKKEIEKILC